MVSKVQVSQCVTYNKSIRNQFFKSKQRREKLHHILSGLLILFVFSYLCFLFLVKSADQVDEQAVQAHAYLAQIEAQKLRDHAGE
ncbi:hypothetical protein [Acinetobacter sp. HY1485]|uniref:hypothetical protein n=1 Tax=Acinetobacter sp. HY1485 TaxID=2970918 RepID=UPI0022B9710C|nr:hypothetical protein [Acinetobacter sp. HY1485]